MSIMIKCPCCKTLVSGVHGKPYDLPMWDISEGKVKNDNVDKIILILCNDCEAVLGAYKQSKG